MSKRLIILAPSAGGKSTLMRYLRDNSDLPVFEMDEEVMRANGNEWPRDNDYKDKVLVPQIVKNILEKPRVVYLASYIPEDLLEIARTKGFKVILIAVSVDELLKRNNKRIEQENYDDSSPWIEGQLKTYKGLVEKGLVDVSINGEQDIKTIADEIITLFS